MGDSVQCDLRSCAKLRELNLRPKTFIAIKRKLSFLLCSLCWIHSSYLRADFSFRFRYNVWLVVHEKKERDGEYDDELRIKLKFIKLFIHIVDVDGGTRLSATQKCHLLHWICVDCARQSQAVPVYAMRSVNIFAFLTSFGTFAKYFRTKIVLNANYGYMVSSIGCPSHSFESAHSEAACDFQLRKNGTFDEIDRS